MQNIETNVRMHAMVAYYPATTLRSKTAGENGRLHRVDHTVDRTPRSLPDRHDHLVILDPFHVEADSGDSIHDLVQMELVLWLSAAPKKGYIRVT